ncbi:heat shock protein 70 family, partial [Syncephalis pseudoplumigaleata]
MADTSALQDGARSEEATGVIGIHLGTSRASVAVLHKDGRPHLVANEDGDRMVPAYVAFTGGEEVSSSHEPIMLSIDDSCLIEDPAVDEFRGHGSRVALTEEHGQLQLEIPPEEQWNDDGELVQAGEASHYTPEQVVAVVMRQLRASAESALGRAVTGAVLAYPAHFSSVQRAGLCRAAQMAGLAVYQAVSEPAAAQLAFDASAAPGDVNRLVIDMGGTTFRVHAYAIRGGLYSRLASRTEANLGGRALDRALAGQLQRDFTRRHRIDLSDRPRSIAKLILACEATRRILGVRPSAPCSVESIADGIDLNVNVHRAVFDTAIAPLVQRCMAVISDVLAQAGWSVEGANDRARPHEVLLLGGASRLPLLHSQLNKLLQTATAATATSDDQPANGAIKIRTDIEPDEAVALGCAIQASLLAG